jgi:hypothetical protein
MIRLVPEELGGLPVDILTAGACDNTKYCDNTRGCTRCTDDPTGCHVHGTLPAFACFDSEVVMIGTDAINPVLGSPEELETLQATLRERTAAEEKARAAAGRGDVPGNLAAIEDVESRLESALERVREQKSKLQR